MIEFDHKLLVKLHYLLSFYLAFHVREMQVHYLVSKLKKKKNKYEKQRFRSDLPNDRTSQSK